MGRDGRAGREVVVVVVPWSVKGCECECECECEEECEDGASGCLVRVLIGSKDSCSGCTCDCMGGGGEERRMERVECAE